MGNSIPPGILIYPLPFLDKKKANFDPVFSNLILYCNRKTGVILIQSQKFVESPNIYVAVSCFVSFLLGPGHAGPIHPPIKPPHNCSI